MQQQTQQKWYQHWFWYNFFRSNYVTAFWNWFMMLAGKAAEAVLTASVIYSCARLLPSVHLPVQVDNTVFVAQMIALDIGGLSLRKMANQARKDGNAAGALLASRVSTALISIMVLNVVLSVAQSIDSSLSGQLIGVAEGCLLIARAVMAVLYAHVIHSLRSDDQAEQNIPAADVQQLIASAIAEASSKFEHHLTAITAEQSRMLATIQAVQNTPAPVSTIDIQAITTSVIEHFSEQFDLAMKRLTEQHVKVSPVTEQPAIPEHLNTSYRTPNTQKIVQLTPRSAGAINHRETVFTLLKEDEERGPRELARLADCSPATAKNYRDLYFSTRNERNGTDN